MSITTLPKATFARTVRGSGPGLVLAHGAGSSFEGTWGEIRASLAARHTVVGVDYPGSGDTPRSHAPLNADEMADQLVAAAVAEGLDTFALAGFSLGGPLAIRAAARHPDRVSSLILTASFARPDATLKLLASIWRKLYQAGDLSLLAEFLAHAALSAPALEALSADAEVLRTGLDAVANSAVVGTPEQTDLLGRIDVQADLAEIKVPTLVIVTTEDSLVPPNLQRELAAAIPCARTAEIATGHLPFAENPAVWLGLITTFLDRQSARRD